MTSGTPSRCIWASGGDPLMQAYHDREWGVAQRDPRALWEMLMLEGFQAGLSWAIVLRKREAFREAFASFDPDKVARFAKRDVERLMKNAGVIRARAKIEATIAGAGIFCEMRDGGENFADFCWSFSEGKVLTGSGRSLPTQTPLSETISKNLKRRGFKFAGPTIVYAWLQAVGIVCWITGGRSSTIMRSTASGAIRSWAKPLHGVALDHAGDEGLRVTACARAQLPRIGSPTPE